MVRYDGHADPVTQKPARPVGLRNNGFGRVTSGTSRNPLAEERTHRHETTFVCEMHKSGDCELIGRRRIYRVHALARLDKNDTLVADLNHKIQLPAQATCFGFRKRQRLDGPILR